jgi:hypothetical protein
MVKELRILMPWVSNRQIIKNKFFRKLSAYLYNSYLHDKSKQKRVNHSLIFEVILFLLKTEWATEIAILIEDGEIDHKEFL